MVKYTSLEINDGASVYFDECERKGMAHSHFFKLIHVF